MKRTRTERLKASLRIRTLVAACASFGLGSAGAATPVACMPRTQDYTQMWWAEGFPGHSPGAPWLRVIQTGSYAMALDTRALRIVHLGMVSTNLGYEACARTNNDIWRGLPSCDLTLSIKANGAIYRCVGGGEWRQFGGPRLVESGHFMQRADVTDLKFADERGNGLNVEARFETVAWPDRLALVLSARPGLRPIPPGESCFGRIGGGFGLDGSNHFEIPHDPELDPAHLTLELWAFVPPDYRASQRTFPWLACKNRHEEAQGNYGIVIINGTPEARMNIGGGRANEFRVEARRGQMKTGEWNHFAMTYDGVWLRFYVNGEFSGEEKIGRERIPGRDGLAFGRRQDNCGDGYHFRGAIDEIRVYRRALTREEIRQRFARPELAIGAKDQCREWRFRSDGRAATSMPGEEWTDAALEISMAVQAGAARQRSELPIREKWTSDEWKDVSLVLGPGREGEKQGAGTSSGGLTICAAEDAAPSAIQVAASEIPGGSTREVVHDIARGWYRVNLDGVEPQVPRGEEPARYNDAIERVRLVLSNPTPREEMARLLFEKNGRGLRQRFGAAITGISASLRDPDGYPTGIPVQLSKNWHGRPEGGVYAGVWFHGFSQLRVPARSTIELELTLSYGHWGGVAAASHAQLCLIGWGSNQLWDQSALGSWGESICYEPDQAQAQCAILDVRPAMVRSMQNDRPWSWTHNVGGGDFLRFFDPAGERVFAGRMKTAYTRQGPCLTEVTYAGNLAGAIEHAATVSLARTDDLVRGTYHLRLDVTRATPFSRFVIFQIGADTYSYTGEKMMALGNESGLIREWKTQWGGDTYRTEPIECRGRIPWISLHDAVARHSEDRHGAWANRGFVIRSWDARLGGKKAAPWVAEHGVRARGADTSTADILPPPGITGLEPGDFIDATIEHIIVPQFAEDYYGPNAGLRAALKSMGNTWAMIHREATCNDRRITDVTGDLQTLYPAVRIRAVGNRAGFRLEGGLGHVPVTFAGLTTPREHCLFIDGKPLDQGVHGRDFWQTDYDPGSGTWEITFNIPAADGIRQVNLGRRKE